MLANLNLRRGIVLGMLSVLLGGFAPLHAAPIALSPAFEPAVLKGIKIHPDNPLQFDFIVSRGTEDAPRLIKYFIASLTVPEKDLWVNLSPYEKDRIVPESFGQTEMGRDLLAQDYMLKQITASLVYPEGETGKKFWERVYAQAAQKFGTTNIPVNTFNKVWIVPDKAEVYENAKAGTAYVVESTLKVMLESDYLAASKSQTQDTASDALAKQVLREIVIPQLTKEVNEGRNFAQLRQVYNSLILATWYKKKIKDSVLAKVYADKNKVAGVSISDPQEKQKIYERYLQDFKKGAYNYIKEERDPSTGQMVPRKYFSGGASLNLIASVFGVSHDPAALPRTGLDHAMTVQVDLEAVTAPVLDDLNRALASDGGVPNVDKIVSVLWIEVIKGGDEVWQNGPDGKGSTAEQAFELVFRSIDDHHDQWVRKSKQVFDELLGEFFEEQDLPRLYAMHRAVWRHSPELGLRMLDDSIEHILQFYHAARLQKGGDFENYAHTMVDTLYLLKQVEIAQQALGWEKLRAGITSLPAIDRASILTLLGDESHPEELVPDSNLPLKEFIRHIRDFINSPAGRTLKLMQDRLADAVTGYGQKYARALEESQKLLTVEKADIADLKPGDMVKVKLKDDPIPVFAFVADDYQSGEYGQGYFLMGFNLVDQIDLDAGKGLLFFKRENKTSQARIDAVVRLRPWSFLEKDAEGWDVFVSAAGRESVKVSPLGTKRFFDAQGRWIMTVDPFGHVMEQFQYNDKGEMTRIEGLLPSGKNFETRPVNVLYSQTAVNFKGTNDRLLTIDYSLDALFKTPELIPTASGAERIGDGGRGVGVVVLNLFSRLVKDRNLQSAAPKNLRYVGQYPLPHIFYSLHEIGNINIPASDRSFFINQSKYEWEPRPLERIWNETSGIYVHVKDGKVVRAVENLGGGQQHYILDGQGPRVTATAEGNFALQDKMTIDLKGNVISRTDAAMVTEALTAPDGAVFTFEHYVEGARVREHRIEAFSNGRKIGYIHFSVLPGQNGGAIAWMQRAFQPYDRTDGYNGHGAAIFVEPEMTASSQGSYHGIARSLLGMAERTAFGEGARKFQAQEVSPANFNNFYRTLGYADAGESQAYGKDITVVKELNENTFAALGIGTEKGGIDFDPGKIDLRIRNSGGKIGSSIDPALLERLQGVSGFAPVIVHVQPLEDLRLFLGVTD